MSIFIIGILGIVLLFWGKYLFKRWFNPLSLYSFVWMTILMLYNIKLIKYIDITTKVWIIIALTSVSFLVGILTVFTSRSLFKKNNNSFDIVTNSPKNNEIFSDGGKVLKYTIILFSTIGLLAAFQHWLVLINEYGNITNVLFNASKIYHDRVKGITKGVIPFISSITYFALFLGGIYTAYKNKIQLFVMLPFVALILKALADVSRTNLLSGFLLFTVSLILFKYALFKPNKQGKINKSTIFSIGIVIVFVIAAATAVKTFRQPMENYKAASQELKSTKSSLIISPTIYLYTSAHVGVLTKYFENDKEHPYFGENTFLPIFRLLSKYNIVPKKDYYQRGYFIPMWVNTGTYLREIHADFGYIGLITVPFLLGLFTTKYWFDFYSTYNLTSFVTLAFLIIFILFTGLIVASRQFNYLVIYVSLPAVLYVVKKLAVINASDK